MQADKTLALVFSLLLTGAAALLAWRALHATPTSPPSETPAVNAANLQDIYFGMGCFWGAEKRLRAVPGVAEVEVGYAGGDAPKVDYEGVLREERLIRAGRSQARNHAEVVRVRYDPKRLDLMTLLAAFWENHDPTQVGGQGNDIGSNYRSAIYFTSEAQKTLAEQSRAIYQANLTKAGYGAITTEILPVRHYNRAEESHQDYLVKNPDGYCGLGGTGVKFGLGAEVAATPPLDGSALRADRQLVVYEAEDCPYCEKFEADVLSSWKADVPFAKTRSQKAPTGWTLAGPLLGTPTIVLFQQGKEVSRFTGYAGDAKKFWQWLGFHLLTPEQQRIAFESGTELPGTGAHLNEARPGTYFDPVSGAALFRSDAKFDSACGWPSFFEPMPGALQFLQDDSHGMHRIEVRSASSGIHLGHVFDDGPPPTGKRYCINGNVLKFVPDAPKA
ncbi:peptide-methionine (S)-S-oxide reductase MsrA [Thermomonas sp.]|uniref:peptide-methionine (S)-S-oxide reductase MsrA n=1 Tax=Thermomonas sp. TaxID=1971895 RepID=UPI0035AF8502